MRIERIEKSKHKQERVLVFLEGAPEKFFFFYIIQGMSKMTRK